MRGVSSHTRFRSGHRSAFHFELDRNETASDAALRHVREWLGEDSGDAVRSALYEWSGAESTVLPNGTDVSVFTFDDERSLDQIIRYRVIEDGPSGPLRVTLSAFKLQRGKDLNAVFVIDAANTSVTPEEAMATVTTPTIVANILNDRRVSDSQTRLQGNPRVMHEHDDLHEVVAAIADPNRQVSVIVASSPDISEDAQWKDRVDQLTRDSRGVAACFVVTSNAVGKMNELLPEHLRIEPGHVRTFAPLVEFDNTDDQVRHRDLTRSALVDALEGDQTAAESLVRAHARDPRRFLLEQPLPPVARRKLKFLDAQQRSARIEELVKESRTGSAKAPEVTRVEDVVVYPSRKDFHNGDSDGDRVWQILRNHLALWLGTDGADITEETLEANIADLDALITAERRKLAQAKEIETEVQAYQSYVAEIEQGSEEAENALAEERRLKEEALQETAVYQEYLEDHRVLNAYYCDQLQHSDIRRSIDPATLRTAEWEVPQSLPALLDLLATDQGERVTRDRIVFTGSTEPVESLSHRDPLGIYAHEVWGIVRTLHDYLDAKKAGAPVGTVEEYLFDDTVSGYKISSRRHISDAGRDIENLARWRHNRTFPAPVAKDGSGEIYMESHFRVGHGSGISPRLYYFDNSAQGGDGRIYIGYIGKRITREDQVGPDTPGDRERKPFKVGKNGSKVEVVTSMPQPLLENPPVVVFEALMLLSQRLNPIIQRHFEHLLDGREWTEILSQMDRARGRVGVQHSTSDLQAQLRMLTERIGSIGYPFDQGGTRIASTHAQALRRIRNRSAHNDPMDSLDAFRTYDHIALLLEDLGDDEGATEAAHLRQALFLNMHDAAQKRVIVDIKEKDRALEEAEKFEGLARAAGEDNASDISPVTPSRIVGARRGAEADTPILGDARFEYEAWEPSRDGEYSVLDVVESGNAPGQVQQEIRLLAEEIVDFEGPVSMERLGSLIGQEHRHARLGRRKRNAIEGLVRGADVQVDDRDFV